MGTSPSVHPPESGRETPPSLADAWGFNLKALVAQELVHLQEMVKELAEIRNEAQQLSLKTLQDAQSAANVHLLNVIDSADKLSKATINSLSNVQANENDEQGVSSSSLIDSVDKTMQQLNATLAALQTVLTDVVSNMASGRPPVNKSGQ